MSDLGQIDWAILQSRDFRRDPDDPGKVERYQAEALVHKTLPCAGLLGITCYDDGTAGELRRLVEKRGLGLQVIKKQGWYF